MGSWTVQRPSLPNTEMINSPSKALSSVMDQNLLVFMHFLHVQRPLCLMHDSFDC